MKYLKSESNIAARLKPPSEWSAKYRPLAHDSETPPAVTSRGDYSETPWRWNSSSDCCCSGRGFSGLSMRQKTTFRRRTGRQVSTALVTVTGAALLGTSAAALPGLAAANYNETRRF